MKNYFDKKIQKTEKTVTVYTLVDNFAVEVETWDEVTHFFMFNKEYGNKLYMFGVPNCTPAVEEELVRANAEDYMAFFEKMHTK